MLSKNVDDAIELIEDTLERDDLQDRRMLMTLLVQSLLATERPDEAVAALHEELASPNVEDPRSLAGLLVAVLFDANRDDEIDDTLVGLAIRFPDHAADLGYQRAMAAMRRGDAERAEQLMLDNLEVHPDHPVTNNDLAYTWAEDDRELDRALALARKAVDAEPDSEAYLDTLGWVHYKRGEFDEAAQWLRRSLAAAQRKIDDADGVASRTQAMRVVRETQAVVLDHLGDALYRSGQHSAALEAWQDALRRLEGKAPPGLEELDDLLEAKVRAARQGLIPPLATVPGADA